MPQPYTHLLPEEVRIWKKFLDQWGPMFVGLDYDVHVGPGAPIPEGAPDWHVRQIEAVSKDRIDVVAHTPGEIWIIEVKPRGGKGAVGQLVQYEREYREELSPTRPTVKVLVCERLAPGVQETCDALGIRVFLMCLYAYQVCNRGAKACELAPPKLGEYPDMQVLAAQACPYAGH